MAKKVHGPKSTWPGKRIMSDNLHSDWDKADPWGRHRGGKLVFSSPVLLMDNNKVLKEYVEARHNDDDTWTVTRIVIAYDQGQWVQVETEIMARSIGFDDVMHIIEAYERQKESESSGGEGGVTNKMRDFWTLFLNDYKKHHTPRHRRLEERREREKLFNPKWTPY